MPDSILTPLQRRVLMSLFQNNLGRRGYYLTGGTALAELYLHHRYSDDLDFFTRKQDRLDQDFGHFLDLIPSLGLTVSSKTLSGDYLKNLYGKQAAAKMNSRSNSREMCRRRWRNQQFARE